MSEAPSTADVVVIGAGIVGNSLTYHLSELGWKNIVQIDKGPLPNPGGSTGHASNFIFPVDHSKEMALVTRDSVRQYKELGVFTESGGIEVAREPERMEELRRRMASSKSWGEYSELITPEQIVEMVPYVDPSILLGGFYTPGVGVVDSLRAGTIMRERAHAKGNLTVLSGVEVIGIDTDNGRVTRVRTTGGDIEAGTVAIAAGVWSPRLARMAGATIPLTPAVHQMISVGPVPLFASTVGEIEYPIIRDMDTFMYERQHGGDLEIGSYAHRPILHHPDTIPSNEAAALSPTEMPFTEDDFALQYEHALELMPELLTTDGVGQRYAINGLLSLTADGLPVVGETEVKGLWSVAAIWVKEGPGFGRLAAELMTHGESEIDGSQSDINRFWDYARTEQFINARTSEGFNKMYGIVHPSEQWESERPLRVSPAYDREKALGAFFFETAGWERPQWYQSNEGLLSEYASQIKPRDAEWESRWWSPIIQGEHLAMRERAGLVDLSAFAIFEITGPGALEFMQTIAVAQMNVPVGRVVYTPVLTPKGGFRADVTITRLGENHFRFVTGGAHGSADKKWLTSHLPADGTVTVTDMSSAYATFGLWGPKARDILGAIAEDDVSNEALPYGVGKDIFVGPLRIHASRVSYVGELGWELYVPMEQGGKLWDMIYSTGQSHGLVPVGIGVYGTSGRLEKSYRAYGAELEEDFTAVEAGLIRPKVKDHDFIGREAHLRQRETTPDAILCTLTVDDTTSSTGVQRYMMGREPIMDLEGNVLVDARGRRSYVTSAGTGPSVGKHILMAYLPPAQAELGTKLQVEYMGEQYPVTVAVAGNGALFDPENSRVRG